jgi:hypothetical protein
MENVNSIRLQATRHFGYKMREYLKDKINWLATTGKHVKNYENSDLLADSHNILNRLKNCFHLLLNIHRVSAVRQIEKYIA